MKTKNDMGVAGAFAWRYWVFPRIPSSRNFKSGNSTVRCIKHWTAFFRERLWIALF